MLVLTAGLGVAAAGLATAASRLAGRPAVPTWPQALGLLVLLLLAGAVRLRFGTRGTRDGDTLDLFEAALGVALVATPAGLLVPLVAVAKVLSLGAQGVRGLKLAFNAALWGCAVAAGSLVLAALRDPGPLRTADLLPLLPALGVVWVVNATAVLALLSVLSAGGLSWAALSGGGLRGLWRGPSASLRDAAGLDALVGVGLGVTFAAVCSTVPQAWPALPLVLLALHLAARDWAQRRAGSARLVGLQRACATLAGEDLDGTAAATFLAELRTAFACRGAELHLAPGTVGSGQQWSRWQAPGAAAPPAPPDLVAGLVATGRAVRLPGPGAGAELPALLASAGWRDCLAAPVRSRGRVVGVLCTHDRQGWEGFESGELAVLEAAAYVLGEAVHRVALAAVVEQERAALAGSEARWRALVQHASDLVLVLTVEGRVGYASPSCDRLLGGPAASLRVRDLLDRVHPDDREPLQDAVRTARALGTGSQAPCEIRVAAPQGDWRTLEVVLSNLEGDGAVDGVVLNARDVTERRLAEGAHLDQARVLELVATGAPLTETLGALAATLAERSGQAAGAGLLPAGAAPHTVVAGAGAGTAEELAALLSAELAHGAGPDASRVAELSTGQRVRLLTVGTAGQPAALALTGPGARPAPPGGAGGGAWLLEGAARVARLAVEHADAQQRLAHQAGHDALTDLPNRAVFLDRLGQALRLCGRTGTLVLVLFLDLDRFKTVNDSLGHAAGDALLRAVAGRLRQAVRPGDTVARFGGDEFTMLCEGLADEAGALEVVGRVREVLAKPFPLGDSELFATSSIGLALSGGPTGSPGAERSPETLLEQADAAMYRAKEKGGNCFELFDAGMRDRARRRLELQSALHRGLERREFRVHYQPTVDLRTGAVVGVEALARWDRHEHGIVLPAEFIPLAEEDGLIVEIGAQVLEQAFLQAGQWHDGADRPLGPSVNVNLSTRQLVDPGLVGRVHQALERASVDPARIALEITESALISDVATSTATLAALKRLGVRLYVDDFGTGYSSLAYLQRFPVDGVKVDRSFVADLGRTADAEAIVRAVIGLAATMGLDPIAEGVETAAQVRWLRDLGCDVAQGFYLGRPVPAERVQLGPRGVHASGLITLPA